MSLVNHPIRRRVTTVDEITMALALALALGVYTN
jgi:hypothetical protein